MGTTKRTSFIHRLPRHYYLSLFLIVAALIVFARSYRFEFLNYEDGINIYDNPHVKQSELGYFLKGQHLGLYIPLTYELWALQARFAKVSPARGGGIGLDPQLFHLSNIIAHLLSILMVFFILRILLKSDWAAWAGALLFGLHPVQVEPVAWITGFKNVLSGLLSLAAIWQYLSYAASDPSIKTYGRSLGIDGQGSESIKKKRRVHYIAAAAFFVLAILAMPMAIVAPVVAGMLSYWVLRRSFRQCCAELIPWILLALPIIILTKISQPDLEMEFVAPLWQRPLLAGDAVTFYFSKLAWPVSLGPDYGRSPDFVLEHNWIYFTGLLPYLFGVILVWKWHRPWLMASLGVFIGGVLPVLGFVAFVFQDISIVADRYLYLAMLTGKGDLWGYDPGVSERYAQFMAFTQQQDPDQASQYLEFKEPNSLYRMLRLRYVLSPAGQQAQIVEMPGALERLVLLYDYTVVTGRDRIFAAMSDHFDPARTVILEEQPEPAPRIPAPAEVGKARIVDAATDFLEIQADLSGPAILLITDGYSKGWRAQSLVGSDQSRYQVMPANYVLMAVPLAAGHHHFRLVYAPRAFKIGTWISLASLALFLSGVTFLRWRKKTLPSNVLKISLQR